MRLLLDDELSEGLARGLNSIASEKGDGKVGHIYTEYPDLLANGRWKGRLLVDGWCVLSGAQRVEQNFDEIDKWKRTGVPVAFVTPELWGLEVRHRAAIILLAWPRLVEKFQVVGLYEISARSAVSHFDYKPPRVYPRKIGRNTKAALAAEQAVPVAPLQGRLRF